MLTYPSPKASLKIMEDYMLSFNLEFNKNTLSFLCDARTRTKINILFVLLQICHTYALPSSPTNPPFIILTDQVRYAVGEEECHAFGQLFLARHVSCHARIG